jgi:predicted  nucleic acid-binding Zn-ribbon protein
MHLSRANSVPSKNNMSMSQVESNVERIQTRIDMIRQESRTLSFRIERMTEQRKNLTQEKNALKDLLTELDVSTTK